MRPLIYILLAAICLTGCVRKTVSELHESRGVLNVSGRDSASWSRIKERIRIVRRDTAVGVREKEAALSLTPEAVAPVFAMDGKVVGRTYSTRQNGITATATVKPDGGVDVKCKADSFAILLTGAIEETSNWRDCTQYWKMRYAESKVFHERARTKKENTGQTIAAFTVSILVIAFIIVALKLIYR